MTTPTPNRPEPTALTNCDSCANDYPRNGDRRCREIDAVCANGEQADALFDWADANTSDDGIPHPGATGCPGHTPKPVTHLTPATPAAGDARRAEIRARLAAATPGPWAWTAVEGGWDGVGSASGTICKLSLNLGANALLIAHAPTDLQWLLDELDRLDRSKS